MTTIAYSSEWFKIIAEENTILRTQVGSGLHGVSIAGTDDRDEMGICIEPPECVIGLNKFEQYQYRTQPEGVRSGPGDLDLVVYSLRKWTKLAAQGNPTVIMLLFAPQSEIVTCNAFGYELRNNHKLFITKDCGDRFVGYLESQRDQMMGWRSKHTNRPELIQQYGYDTKFAYHAVRLGLQGIELMLNGYITLPMPESDRKWLMDIRLGKIPKDDVMHSISTIHHQLVNVTLHSDLPDRPNYDEINDWLVETYKTWWNP